MEEYGYDDALPLDKQYYEGKTTWFDVIVERTIDTVIELVVACEAAKAEGIELTDNNIVINGKGHKIGCSVFQPCPCRR